MSPVFGGRGRGVHNGGHSILGLHPSTTTSSYGRISCQICSRTGHLALDLYNKLNLSFEGRVPTKKLSAMAASVSTPSSSTWLLDSGANAHVTSDLNNLQFPKEYTGTDQIGGTGTNSSLPISHVGSSLLKTGNQSFKLNNILYCPSASTNLLSLYQFSSDNDCYFLISPTIN